MAAAAALRPRLTAMAFMALLVECGLEINNGSFVFFPVA